MPDLTQEDIDQAVEEKTKSLQDKITQLEQQLQPQNPDDPFGPNWSPSTAQDMGRDIMKAVESKFPELAKQQQDQLADAVIAKMEEKNKNSLEEQKKTEDAQLQAQIDFIKQTDKDFDEKKMWDFLKEYKGEQPKSVAEAYQTYKKEYKEPEPEIGGEKPKDEGTHPVPQRVPGDTDKAMAEAMAELGIE